jgi:hypothetical protein
MRLYWANEIADDLAGDETDVTGRDVGVLPDVAMKLGHQALAEPHDLVARAALELEVRTTPAVADGHPAHLRPPSGVCASDAHQINKSFAVKTSERYKYRVSRKGRRCVPVR